MKAIIMGCGRVGEQVSRRLDEKGHDVVVIDQDESAAARLGPRFGGRFVVGLGFDQGVLLKAGIKEADAFAATSSSDNANVVAARIARNLFRVPRVVARLYDPRRAEIYERLGIETISSTMWGAERIYELLTHRDLDTLMSFGHGEVTLVALEIPPHVAGRTVNQLIIPGEVDVVAITRDGAAFLPTLGTEFKSGDEVHCAVHARAMSQFERLMGLAAGG